MKMLGRSATPILKLLFPADVNSTVCHCGNCISENPEELLVLEEFSLNQGFGNNGVACGGGDPGGDGGPQQLLAFLY